MKLHCAALPDTLIESELFGYEKGAFTGAASRKPGRVELAQGGTLFLDEIGDISPFIQVKLLRLLQDREFERLGGTQTLKSTARFVAATHQPLEELIKQRTFREDLFYRLNVLPIWIPPLRDRGPRTSSRSPATSAAQFGDANGRGPLELAGGRAGDRCEQQPWPGNVRELQNFIERLVVLSDGDELTAADVDARAGAAAAGRLGPHGRRRPATDAPAATPAGGAVAGTLEASRRDAEREAIVTALDKSGNNRVDGRAPARDQPPQPVPQARRARPALDAPARDAWRSAAGSATTATDRQQTSPSTASRPNENSAWLRASSSDP